MEATRPRCSTSRLISATLNRDSGIPCCDGSSHARRLTSMATLGGKAGRTPAPRALFETSQAFLKEAFSPLADDLSRRIESLGDFIVRQPLGGIENDSGSHYVTIW